MKKFGIVYLTDETVETIREAVSTTPVSHIMTNREQYPEYFAAIMGLFPDTNPVQLQEMANYMSQLHFALVNALHDGEEDVANEDKD